MSKPSKGGKSQAPVAPAVTQPEVNVSMTLWGAAVSIAKSVADVIVRRNTYVPKRVKGEDGKSVVVKDKDGKPVLALRDGKPIVASTKLALLPRAAKDGKASLTSITGKTGKDLDAFEIDTRRQLATEAIAKFTSLISDGTHTFAYARDNRSGVKALAIRPLATTRGMVTATNDQLMAELKRRGLIEAPEAPEAEQK